MGAGGADKSLEVLQPCGESGFQTRGSRKPLDVPNKGVMRLECCLDPSDYTVESGHHADKNGSRNQLRGAPG